MSKDSILAPKQVEFILNSNSKFNIAWGAVRSGKTTCCVYRFMQCIYDSAEDQNHWAIGHTSTTIKKNAIDPILYPPPPGYPDPFAIFRPFCTWHESKRELVFGNKIIHTCGVRDKGSEGIIQGATFSTCYADEMTLWADNVLEMAKSRLSRPYSKLFGSLNPTYPSHKIKSWIDWSKEGDKNYYELHFDIDDNPYLDQRYKDDLKKSSSGIFYKRNYLGQWCLAEGAIFDFFDRAEHVVSRPPAPPEYYIAGIDYGTSNAFACLLIGINTGRLMGYGRRIWVEKEYFWDSKKTNRQKSPYEFANDVKRFLEPYGVRGVYLDPSAAFFKEELSRLKIHCIASNNEVDYGIQKMIGELKDGTLKIMDSCPNLIREMEGYVWDSKRSERGYDEPLKKDDHAVDALRYAIATHKITSFDVDDYYRKQNESRPRY